MFYDLLAYVVDVGVRIYPLHFYGVVKLFFERKMQIKTDFVEQENQRIDVTFIYNVSGGQTR